ncbi:hypothetical protein [Vreelandella arcis]|uniref:Uncharacterized protein n=1 Tax=Vreelandella arcis TaxID=416873 RepID=A0A1H0J003_9GAMM|nr:hypothetical protein [Halomonas arcis]SDO36759.1 hypothetical protein SAMN04487951_1231 [Halomonas arcis]
MKVQVQSAIMSYGKSVSAIKTIQSETDNFYFVVLPYLEEVNRYKNECNSFLPDWNQLIEPSNVKGSKNSNLLINLKERTGSVVTTHAMFDKLSDEQIRSIKKRPMFRGEKMLVLDETIDLVKPVSSSKITIKELKADVENGYIVVNETTGLVTWNNTLEFEGKEGSYRHHEYLKNLCETGMLYFLDGRYVIMELSMDFLECFDRVLVLTYRWTSSIMANFLKVNGIKWEVLPLNQERVLDVYKYISEHLVIPDEYSIDEYKLSQRGWNDNAEKIKNLFNGYVKQAMRDYDIPLEEVLYTTFKFADGEDMQKYLKTLSIGKYQKKDKTGNVVPVNFLSHTTLGTNDYKHCRLMVYGVSKHIMPGVQSYFAQKGSSMPGDDWELSSIIQWLFRGCIRDQDSGKDMIAVILCPRMRKMVQSWLAGIKRQVEQGSLDESSKDVIEIDPKTRRKKMQNFKQWIQKNPGGECFSFHDYLEHGGPNLKRKLKKIA